MTAIGDSEAGHEAGGDLNSVTRSGDSSIGAVPIKRVCKASSRSQANMEAEDNEGQRPLPMPAVTEVTHRVRRCFLRRV